MQSRRREDRRAVSPSMRLHRQQGFDTKQDSMGNLRSRPDASLRRKIEGAGRLALHEDKVGSTERREYGWHLGTAPREKVCPGSPRQFRDHGRIHLDDPRTHSYVDYKEYENRTSNGSPSMYKHEYHRAASRVNNEDYVESEIHSGCGIWEQKSLQLEDRMTRRPYTVHQHMARTPSYEEEDAPVPLASHSRDFLQFENKNLSRPGTRHEKLSHREFIEHEKIQFRNAIEQKRFHHQENDEPDTLRYREPTEHQKLRFRDALENERFHRQEPMEEEDPLHLDPIEHKKLRYQEPIHFEKVRYRTASDHQKFHSKIPVTASDSKNIEHVTQVEYYPCSSGVERSEYPGSYEGMPFSASLDYSRSSMEFTESEDYNGRDQRIMSNYLHSNYRSIRCENDEYLDSESQEYVSDDNVYPSDYISRRVMHPCAHLNPEHISRGHERGESFRPIVMHPVGDRIGCGGGSLGSMRASAVRINPGLQQEVSLENLDERRIYSLKPKGERLCPDCCQMEVGINESRDSPASYSGITDDHQFSHLRSEYGFGREVGHKYLKDRLPDMPMHDNFEYLGIASKRLRMEDHSLYNLPDKIPKRNYSMEEHIDQHDTRFYFPRDSVLPREYEDPYNDEEWIDETIDAQDSHRHKRFYSLKYSKGSMYDEPDEPRDSSSDVWFQSGDSPTCHQRNLEKHYKSGVNFVKSQHKSGSLRWHKSYDTKGSGLHRQHKVIRSSDSYVENADVDDDGPSEGLATEPCEESEEFKQLVHEAFLTYSKRLNLHPAVQKRYKEQGKAGSLFCIVCGRRSSKEFLDTQRLVTHSFMSHKAGLRAKHLGLHKAVCVLMGWSTDVPCDTVTWVPEVLPDSVALSQKEDLILWPPLVIVHNISMSNNNPKGQSVVPIEKVASFLRGKGFVEGKMKVALGRPADQSIILLKFLGTFTGLSNAERIHRYFSDNSRGRVEFQRKVSSKSSSSSNGDVGTQRDKIEEQLLYGYMGMADDLDRLDFNTKQWILIKSKKEIQELADAPVKTSDR